MIKDILLTIGTLAGLAAATGGTIAATYGVDKHLEKKAKEKCEAEKKQAEEEKRLIKSLKRIADTVYDDLKTYAMYDQWTDEEVLEQCNDIVTEKRYNIPDEHRDAVAGAVYKRIMVCRGRFI